MTKLNKKQKNLVNFLVTWGPMDSETATETGKRDGLTPKQIAEVTQFCGIAN